MASQARDDVNLDGRDSRRCRKFIIDGRDGRLILAAIY
jgi:hypothetical protein